MKYTNCLKYQLGIFAFIFSTLSLHLYAQAPTGLVTPEDNSLTFANQLDIVLEAKSIEISVQLSTKGSNGESARTQHLKDFDALRKKVLASSASVTSSIENDIDVNGTTLARLPFARAEAQSDFTVQVTTDTQLAKVARILSNTKGVKIKHYDVIYDQDIGSDEELKTQLTNQILDDIRKRAKETGRSITPRGFSELNVETTESGRDQLENLLEGKPVRNWSQSAQGITLIQTTKKVSIALKAS